MTRAAALLIALTWFASLASAQQPVGFLLRQTPALDGTLHQACDPYVPSEGDVVFFNDHSQKWGCLYKLVGSDWPYHAALICKLPDGRPGIVEAGPNDTLTCRVLEVSPRFHGFRGTVYVRRLMHPLTPRQSAALTKFAVEQDNKRYALGRLLLQATPFRCRWPVRHELFGATYTDRCSYLCAELVVAGGTVAGIFDPQVHKANTIYPRDIIYNDINDLSRIYHDVQVWTPTPVGVSPPLPTGEWDRYASLISALPQGR